MLKVDNLCKRFTTDQGKVYAVESVGFNVEPGSFFTLLGPSGCGKTTTLRCVAGLEKPEAGKICIGNEIVVSAESGVFVPPNKRDIAMVFQSYAIWPHMNVFDNVAFALSQGKNKIPKKKVKEKVEKALSMVQLSGLEKRPAPQLSGGQQQRLALARALAKEPKLILLDEPLSNLDAKLREGMRIELKRLLNKLKITALYVTHDQVEALVMSDMIAVMLNGRIIEVNTPKEIYSRPQNKFTANFIGTNNFFEGTIDNIQDGNRAFVKSEGINLECLLPDGYNKNDKVLLAIRPEDIKISKNKAVNDANITRGKVETIAYLGDFIDCRVLAVNRVVDVKLSHDTMIKEGDSIILEFPMEFIGLIRN